MNRTFPERISKAIQLFIASLYSWELSSTQGINLAIKKKTLIKSGKKKQTPNMFP